jgi:transcriptional regulator with XRE-family HTH domain
MTEKDYLLKIGANMTRIRKKRGLTINEVAMECDMDKSNLIHIEKGRINVTFHTLYKIAAALDSDVKEFFES